VCEDRREAGAVERRAPAAVATGAADGLRPRRILVVDDHQDAANSLARLLKRLYRQEVRVAYDGPTALEAAGAFRPDVVLLDIGMPGMDGYEVARRFRALPDVGGATLVALTGWGQDADRRRTAEAGFDRHLVKPVDPRAIRALLDDPGATAGGGPG
jgi:CheY-like chemotaxis protein